MVEKLRDEKTRQEFDLELQNQFDILFDQDSSLDEAQERTDSLNLALEYTCKKVLGKRPKNKHPNWISSQTHQFID